MDKLRQLEVNRLFKELDYVEADFEYKSEMISESDINFKNHVNLFLEKNPELKEIFDDKFRRPNKINNIGEIFDDSENDGKEQSEEISDKKDIEKSDEIKRIYRDIVKITHPDKDPTNKLSEIYIKSTNAYHDNDIVSMYLLCNKLKIEYEISEEIINDVVRKIETLKERIQFLESTLTWRWKFTENSRDKDRIVLKYIENQLLR